MSQQKIQAAASQAVKQWPFPNSRPAFWSAAERMDCPRALAKKLFGKNTSSTNHSHMSRYTAYTLVILPEFLSCDMDKSWRIYQSIIWTWLLWTNKLEKYNVVQTLFTSDTYFYGENFSSKCQYVKPPVSKGENNIDGAIATKARTLVINC